ncbi:hypothetical protein [Bradyrhizobium sp. DASA03120]|uniref:hypothetical protein n=1 Tax=Bradyrhizobium sp. SMVTL-02 TaxID=3395917 RepID=UPI003F728B0E
MDRFRCPADPVLAAKLAKENIAAILFGGGPVMSRMGEALRGANIFAYVGLSMPAERYMSNWLPPDVIDHKEATNWAAPLLLAWMSAMLLGIVSTGRALVRAARARKMDARLMLPILLVGIVLGWGATQLTKNAYEASLALPATILSIVLAIRAAEFSEITIRCAQIVSRFTLVVAAASLVALMAFYAKPLWVSAHQPGYVALQPYSVSPYGFSKIEDQIVATGRLCGIDPAKRPSGLLIDDLTYFAYMASYRPLHRTGVLSDWNGSIIDPVAYLATRRSSGIVLGCSYLPPALRQLAHSIGQFCCIGPLDWSQRSPRGQ